MRERVVRIRSLRRSGGHHIRQCAPAKWPGSALREVRARYGVDPKQVPDFIALRGDPSDKLPGALGVGAVGAAALLRRYGTLEKALAGRTFSGASQTTPAIPFDRHHESQSAANRLARLEAYVGERRRSREEVAAQSIGKAGC
jgi:5'-3' exonuclease